MKRHMLEIFFKRGWGVTNRKIGMNCRTMFNCESKTNGDCKTPQSYTAGIIVIGDEILKGQTVDTNSAFLTKKLFHLGVKVGKISVVPDDVNVISDEVLTFSKRFNFVITSGGIGPTHDDLTFESIAKAFNENLYPHPEIVKACKKFLGTDDLKNPKLKIAFVPESAKLLFGRDKINQKDLAFPLVVIKNVYVFPGVSHFMEKCFESLEEIFRNPEGQNFTHELYIDENEYSITHVINEANSLFQKTVTIGSYPAFHNNYYKVFLTLESSDKSELKKCTEFFSGKLQKYILTDFDKNPLLNISEKVYNLCRDNSNNNQDFNESLITQLKNSINTIEKAFETYQLNEICVGFNGGKDCTLLLHLVYAVMMKKYTRSDQLNCLYIRRGLTFPEVEQFITKSLPTYNINLYTVNGRIKDALAEFKSDNPNFKAVIMGTRLTDPHSSHLEDFHPTDEGWPEYMRVNPLLHWTYGQVWTVIRKLSLPYCSLYDVGYTSLGSMDNTHPNPALQVVDSKGSVLYKPAYKLGDFNSERLGRN